MSECDILFLTSGYPTEHVTRYPFLDALVCAMAENGVASVVIYPVSITHALIRKEKLPAKVWERITVKGRSIRIFSPRFVTFSSPDHRIARYLVTAVNNYLFRRAVDRVVRRNRLQFQYVYGHFISPSGIAAVWIGKKYHRPSCFAYGENSSYTIDEVGIDRVRRKLKSVCAVVSVSSENRRILVENRIVRPEIVGVFPNAVNHNVFHPYDRGKMREKFDFPKDVFIVAFVGYFTNTKGSLRLSDAIDELDDIHAIFIGNGDHEPTCRNILFKGNLPHDRIAEMISAADIFVLPTIEEGCCNAIIEALACGLPVVSSSLPFNDDILDENCAIRVDTTSVAAIREAIQVLMENPERRASMRKAAIQKANELEIHQRAGRIWEWMNSCKDMKR